MTEEKKQNIIKTTALGTSTIAGIIGVVTGMPIIQVAAYLPAIVEDEILKQCKKKQKINKHIQLQLEKVISDTCVQVQKRLALENKELERLFQAASTTVKKSTKQILPLIQKIWLYNILKKEQQWETSEITDKDIYYLIELFSEEFVIQLSQYPDLLDILTIASVVDLEKRVKALENNNPASSKRVINITVKEDVKKQKTVLQAYRYKNKIEINTRTYKMIMYGIALSVSLFLIFLSFGIGKIIINNCNSQNNKYWDGKSSLNEFEESGRPDDPICINNGSELARIAYMVNNSRIDFKNTYFKLTNDIYLNELDINKREIHEEIDDSYNVMLKPSVNKWETISKFAGHFDGNNKTIYRLFIDTNMDNYQGLFGYCTEDSVIENLTVTDSHISGSEYVGVICGKSQGIINNCKVEGKNWVTGSSYVGGLVGDGNIIINASTTASVQIVGYKEGHENWDAIKKSQFFGGIAGKCNYIINSASYSRVETPFSCAGGIAREVTKDAYNCISANSFLDSQSTFVNYNAKMSLENNYVFLYGDVFGCYRGETQHVIHDNKIYYLLNRCKNSYELSDDDIYQKITEKYTDITFKTEIVKYEDPKILEILGKNTFENHYYFNHEYSLVNNQYNSMTKEIDFDVNSDNIIEELNENIKLLNTGIYSDTDIENILLEYGTNGKKVALLEWDVGIKDEKQVPVLKN